MRPNDEQPAIGVGMGARFVWVTCRRARLGRIVYGPCPIGTQVLDSIARRGARTKVPKEKFPRFQAVAFVVVGESLYVDTMTRVSPMVI